MSTFINRHADLLGIDSEAAPKVIPASTPIVKWMVASCIVLGLFGGLVGKYVEYKEAERAELARQQALKKAEQREKNRELNAKIDEIHARGQRYEYKLEQERARLFRGVENLEQHRDKIPRVRQFLDQFPLPDDVRKEISQKVDFLKARGADTFDLQVNKIPDPQNVEKERQRWEELLGVAGRYVDGIDRNIRYFNGGSGQMWASEEFRREFGRAVPKVEAEPEVVAEPVAEQSAVPAATAEPLAEAKPEPAAKPAPRPAAPPKPRTIPIGNGGVQVTDW